MPTKRYTTVPEQLAKLADRGMLVDGDAKRWLDAITYYRLSGYTYVYRILDAAASEPTRGDAYVPGTRFAYIAGLYEFDRKLRALLFDGLERVEVSLRRGIAEVVGERHPLGYRDADLFRENFNHAGWLHTVDNNRLARAKTRDAAIKHHFKKYGGECPVWVVVDVLDFMDASTLFEGMRIREQFQVAEAMGIRIDLEHLSRLQRGKVLSVHPMARWLEQATVARNISAHHGRLWNRGLAPASGSAMRSVRGMEGVPGGQSESVFGLLCFVAAVLNSASPGSSWASKVRNLIDTELLVLPGRSAQEMGAPDDWQSLPTWSR